MFLKEYLENVLSPDPSIKKLDFDFFDLSWKWKIFYDKKSKVSDENWCR